VVTWRCSQYRLFRGLSLLWSTPPRVTPCLWQSSRGPVPSFLLRSLPPGLINPPHASHRPSHLFLQPYGDDSPVILVLFQRRFCLAFPSCLTPAPQGQTHPPVPDTILSVVFFPAGGEDDKALSPGDILHSVSLDRKSPSALVGDVGRHKHSGCMRYTTHSLHYG